MGQEDNEILTVVVTVKEALQGELHHAGMSGDKSRETPFSLIWNQWKITIETIKEPVHNAIVEL